MTTELEDVFVPMLTEHLYDLRSGKLPKSKFIGKYIEQLRTIDKDNAFRYRKPQVIGEGKEPDNNWLNYVVSMSEDEFENFKTTLKP